ncbi:hypothetical protein HELRODRAFT_194005 [Helobdella robusta]|uniref:Apple domain-containing protein n=1 Tax=Helobdella robusta TaxID=6412 RepID=T1FVK1_HELRO|nr:hypothetical protein HELRODRAFT_194005 [Helobdella robusta]ESN93646.1 hypothetical protein HELRODRAFT_194005 [Helobdella robusta]
MRMLRTVLVLCSLLSTVISQICQWSDTPDTLVFGGVGQNNYNDINSCKAACYAAPSATCVAINFDPNGSPKCFFFNKTTDLITNSGKSGITWSICNKVCTWNVYKNSQRFGGISSPLANSLDACKKACLDNSSCQAVDFAPGNQPGTQCYLFITADISINYNAVGVDHYVCSVQWTSYKDMNVAGGTPQLAQQTLTDCQNFCITQVSGCQSIDFNPNDPTYKCWTFTPYNTNEAMKSAPGITHYVFSTGVTVINTQGQGTNQGSCVWQPYVGGQSGGGTYQQQFTTLSACQAGCVPSAACLAFEWTTSGQCWFFNSAAAPTQYGVPGITHYVWNCQMTQGNLCAWTTYTGQFAYGGYLDNNIKSLSECQTKCSLDASCKAVEWVTTNIGSQCFLFNRPEDSKPPSYYSSNIVHYTKSCYGASTTAIPMSTCTWQRYNGLQYYGGTYQNNIDSEDKCKAFCLSRSSCKAIEFVPIYSQCYTFTVSEIPQISNPDINHSILIGCSAGSATTGWTAGMSFSGVSNSGGSCQWSAYYGYQTFGGVEAPSSITSLQDCQSYCLNSLVGCKAVEWVTANLQAKCYTFNSDSVPTKSGLSGIDHYICNSPCTWTLYQNSMMYGGSSYMAATTLDQCKQACINSSNCQAIEFTTRGECYLFSSSQTPPMTNVTGVNHHIYNCHTSTPAVTITNTVFPTISVCPNNTVLENSNTIGGIRVSNANNVDECRSACLANDNRCTYGFDFNLYAPFGFQCWVSTNPFINFGNIKNVKHYYCK